MADDAPDAPSPAPAPLAAAPRSARSARRFLPFLTSPVLLVLLFPFAGRFCGSCFGYEPVVMAQLNACPLATGRLGSPITESYGLSCGNAETEDDDGHASWRQPVSGPKGGGVYRFDVLEKAGVWVVASATLDVGGETVDVRQCAFAARGEGVLAPRVLRGRVDSVSGPAPVAAGAACTATVTPGAGPFGCRVVVACGDATLYGAKDTSGFTRCRVERTPDGREAITALDRPTDPMSDPELDLHTATGEIVVDDRRQAVPFRVRIALNGGPAAREDGP
jgi:hypothetical protein